MQNALPDLIRTNLAVLASLQHPPHVSPRRPHLCSILAEMVRALRLSYAYPIVASALMSASSVSRFASVRVLESANALRPVRVQ